MKVWGPQHERVAAGLLATRDQGVAHTGMAMPHDGAGVVLFKGDVRAGARPGAGTTTIKGVLTIIKGDIYTMQDLSGRFVNFRVDKNSQRERLVVPGERIEVQRLPDRLALSIKRVQ